MTKESTPLREPTLILLSIVAFCSIYSSSLSASTKPAIDFYQFWVVGQEVATGRPGDIYSDLERARIGQRYLMQARAGDDPARRKAAEHRTSLDTFSTPFLYTVFGTLSSGEYERDLSTYRALSLFFVVFSVATLCRLLGYGFASAITAMIIFASWFTPSQSDLAVGNVNHLQLGWLVLFLWLSDRIPTTGGHVLGGVLLGLSALFKPNVVLVIGLLGVTWIVRRQYKKLVFEAIGIAAGGLAAFAWSSAAFGGPGIWHSWFSALSRLPSGLITVELGNYAPVRLLTEWLQVEATLPLTLILVGLALAAIVRGLSGSLPEDVPHGRRGLEDVLVVALAGLVTLLSSPLSWLHYFVAAIPMLLVVLRPRSGLRRDGASWRIERVAAFAALLAIMMRPLIMLRIGTPHDRAVLLCAGTALLLGLGMRELLALREESADSSIAKGSSRGELRP